MTTEDRKNNEFEKGVAAGFVDSFAKVRYGFMVIDKHGGVLSDQLTATTPTERDKQLVAHLLYWAVDAQEPVTAKRYEEVT